MATAQNGSSPTGNFWRAENCERKPWPSIVSCKQPTAGIRGTYLAHLCFAERNFFQLESGCREEMKFLHAVVSKRLAGWSVCLCAASGWEQIR